MWNKMHSIVCCRKKLGSDHNTNAENFKNSLIKKKKDPCSLANFDTVEFHFKESGLLCLY